MDRSRRVGVNFIFKISYFPLILYLFPKHFPLGIFYSSWVVPFLLSVVFIGIGLAADEIILPLFGLVSSTIQGGLFMITFTWLSQFLFIGSRIPLLGALVIGLFLGIGEFFMHQRILSWQRAD
ncbi:MAG TPA: hypothetical protein VJ824_11565 [Bacillota bacterium]|nr:hypothetical protein [Bacillota bacterium]